MIGGWSGNVCTARLNYGKRCGREFSVGQHSGECKWVLKKTYPSSRCDYTRQPRNCRRRKEHGQREQSSSRQSPNPLVCESVQDRMSP